MRLSELQHLLGKKAMEAEALAAKPRPEPQVKKLLLRSTPHRGTGGD